MFAFRSVDIRSFEVGLKFHKGEFCGLLRAGYHWWISRGDRTTVRVVSQRDPWLEDSQLDLIVKSGLLRDEISVVDLQDHQRALVWIDGRFARILGPGLHAYWTGVRSVRVEIVEIGQVRLDHPDLATIVRSPSAAAHLTVCTVQRDVAGVLFVDGRFVTVLDPGTYAFWTAGGDARVVELDRRESQIEVSGQEFMTLDKVSLRINALMSFVVQDPRLAVSAAGDFKITLYREVQLALRAVIGALELDSFLVAKDQVVNDLQERVRDRATALGLVVKTVGIKDVILPGEMKDLMNKVTEAKKAAEANLIARREETAAIRSQVNSAKLLAENPTLMRLRELEVLEKIASAGKLSVVLGAEQKLAEKVVNLL